MIYNEYLKECNLSNYDKLCLGLPVDKDLYIELRKMFFNEIIPNDFETYIKHIFINIKKLKNLTLIFFFDTITLN